jgi:hypothetical protein
LFDYTDPLFFSGQHSGFVVAPKNNMGGAVGKQGSVATKFKLKQWEKQHRYCGDLTAAVCVSHPLLRRAILKAIGTDSKDPASLENRIKVR